MEVAKRYDALRLRALRIPMYSCERLTEILSKSDEEIDEFIKDLCFNEFFLEAILIASGTLYDDVIKLRNGEIHEVKKIINIKISLLEYYLRMCSRTTPFGLFATPVFINNERKTKIAIQKVLHIDYQWCWQFSKILEDKYLKEIVYQVNGFVYKTQEFYCVPYTFDNFPSKLNRTELLNSIMDFCQESRSFDEIVHEICIKNKLVNEDELPRIIISLLRSGFLITNLTPNPSEENYFERLFRNLGDDFKESEIGVAVQEICRKISEYINSIEQNSTQILVSIIADMRELMRSERYVQIDAIRYGVNYCLDDEDNNVISEAVNLLIDFYSKIKSSHCIYREYKDDFLNKYGEYQSIPLVEVLDKSRGIGVPNTYKEFIAKKRGTKTYKDEYEQKLVRYTLKRIQSASSEKKPFVVDDEFLEVLSRVPMSKVLHSKSITVGVFCKRDNKDNKTFVFNSDLGVCIGDIVPLQRYIGDSLKTKSELLVENVADGCCDSICQLQYIPTRLKWANIMRVPLLNQQHIKGFIWDENPEKRINLSQIDVGISEDRFYIKKHGSEKKLSIVTNNMYSFYNDASIVRFLKEVGKDGYVQVSNELLNSYFRYYVHLPEIRYKNVVLYPETWSFNDSDFTKGCYDFLQFKSELLSNIEKYHIPNVIYFKIGDFGLVLNIKQNIAQRILHKSWNKYHLLNLQKSEMQQEGALVLENNTYRTEMLLSFDKNMTEYVSLSENLCLPNDIDKQFRLFSPGSEWIYVKIFGAEDEDSLIRERVIPWCEYKTYVGDAKKFFFVRYKDTDYHLRVRILQSENRLFNECVAWLNCLVNEKKILYFELSTYEKELERYGGVKGVEFAESVFHLESLLSSLLFDESIDKKCMCYIFISLIYIEIFIPVLTERLDWITKHSPDRKQYMNCIKEYKNMDFSIFINSCKENCFDKLIGQLKCILNEYSNYFDDEALKSRALDSLLHMLFNRMIGMERGLEKNMRAIIRYEIYSRFSKGKNKHTQ